MNGSRWAEAAACRPGTGVPPELFQPPSEHGAANLRQINRAKAVCRRCPVRDACLAYAMEQLPYGVAGGTTAEERRAIRQAELTRAVTG